MYMPGSEDRLCDLYMVLPTNLTFVVRDNPSYQEYSLRMHMNA
jgi:hypothetical protein